MENIDYIDILEHIARSELDIKSEADIDLALSVAPENTPVLLRNQWRTSLMRRYKIQSEKSKVAPVNLESERDKYIKLMDSLYDAATRKVKPDRIAGDKWLAHTKAELQEEEIPSETRKQARAALQGMIEEFAECECCDSCSAKVLDWLRKAVAEVDA